MLDGDGVVAELADLDTIRSLEFVTDTFVQERRVESSRLWITGGRIDRRTGDVEDNTPQCSQS